jgi:hypothetical protein
MSMNDLILICISLIYNVLDIWGSSSLICICIFSASYSMAALFSEKSFKAILIIRCVIDHFSQK